MDPGRKTSNSLWFFLTRITKSRQQFLLASENYRIHMKLNWRTGHGHYTSGTRKVVRLLLFVIDSFSFLMNKHIRLWFIKRLRARRVLPLFDITFTLLRSQVANKLLYSCDICIVWRIIKFSITRGFSILFIHSVVQ